jgi:hypothetical protein
MLQSARVFLDDENSWLIEILERDADTRGHYLVEVPDGVRERYWPTRSVELANTDEALVLFGEESRTVPPHEPFVETGDAKLMMQAAEPFRSNWMRTEAILDDMKTLEKARD